MRKKQKKELESAKSSARQNVKLEIDSDDDDEKAKRIKTIAAGVGVMKAANAFKARGQAQRRNEDDDKMAPPGSIYGVQRGQKISTRLYIALQVLSDFFYRYSVLFPVLTLWPSYLD